MRVKQINKEWFVIGVEPYTVDGVRYYDWGPYETKKEAEDDMKGVQKTMDRWERSK